MPLYQEELNYKLENGYEAFLDKIPDEEVPPVGDTRRGILLNKGYIEMMGHSSGMPFLVLTDFLSKYI